MEDKLQKHGNNTRLSREMTILAYLRISFAGRYSEQLDTGSHSQTPASQAHRGLPPSWLRTPRVMFSSPVCTLSCDPAQNHSLTKQETLTVLPLTRRIFFVFLPEGQEGCQVPSAPAGWQPVPKRSGRLILHETIQHFSIVFSTNSWNSSVGLINSGKIWRLVWCRRWGGKDPPGQWGLQPDFEELLPKDQARSEKKVHSCCAQENMRVEVKAWKSECAFPVRSTSENPGVGKGDLDPIFYNGVFSA